MQSPCEGAAHGLDNPPHTHKPHTYVIIIMDRCRSAPAYDACKTNPMPPHTTHTLRRLATAQLPCPAAALDPSGAALPQGTQPHTPPYRLPLARGCAQKRSPKRTNRVPFPALRSVAYSSRTAPGFRPAPRLRSAPRSAQTRSPSRRCGRWHTPAAPRPASGPRPGCRPRRRAGSTP